MADPFKNVKFWKKITYNHIQYRKNDGGFGFVYLFRRLSSEYVDALFEKLCEPLKLISNFKIPGIEGLASEIQHVLEEVRDRDNEFQGILRIYYHEYIINYLLY